MIVKNNILGLNITNRFKNTNKSISESTSKLSSGLRINKAADDAAGLSISEKMRAQIRGMNQAEKNIQDGISLIQTAESGLGNIQDPLLIRLRELAVQAANGSLTDSDRLIIQEEVRQIKEGINDIANNTYFNGINLLNNGLNEVVDDQGGEIKPGSVSFITYVGENISTLGRSTLIGNSGNIQNAIGVEILSGINDQLTIKFDDTAYTINISAGVYRGSSTALYDDINSKLRAIGAPVELSHAYSQWDDTHMRTLLTSTISGNHKIEVEGTAFNEIFTEERTRSILYEVLGREADFSIGYSVKSGVNDTLHIKDLGIDKVIVLAEGTYSRDELIDQLNNQFDSVGADILASFSPAFGVNVSDGPGNKHYILRLTHKSSGSPNAIQLVSGNALNPLFMRPVIPGDVWNPKTKSSLTTNLDLTNGIVINGDSNRWEIGLERSINKTFILDEGSYSSSEFIDYLNNEFQKRSAGMIAVDDNGMLKFEREMNGSSYQITDFKITDISENENGSSSDQTFLGLQVGANQGATYKVQLADVRTKSIGVESINLSLQHEANNSLVQIDKAIEQVSSHRARFGAYQNALGHVLNNVMNASSNLSTAESKIRDADIAKEMMKNTKETVLLQATQAMLAQANQKSSDILQLLR
ncbi:flagellin [Paenibacillus xylanexedens]|uniref:flagellin n=1 Tax=Paenibacillus xylanexedens TaxID=528191 RepID=UPI0028EC5453|nr:flagellin [Paenibacillus xylanexedens]